MSNRPMSLRKETGSDRRWRRFFSGPLGWLWTCHICHLEATWPMDTLADGYAEALDHLEDEHLVTDEREGRGPSKAASEPVDDVTPEKAAFELRYWLDTRTATDRLGRDVGIMLDALAAATERAETAESEARWMRLELRTRRAASPAEETCHDCGHWLDVHREDVGCVACFCSEGRPPKLLEEAE